MTVDPCYEKDILRAMVAFPAGDGQARVQAGLTFLSRRVAVR